jgi:hypothetical protein
LCTPFQSTTFSFALCDFEYITGYWEYIHE